MKSQRSPGSKSSTARKIRGFIPGINRSRSTTPQPLTTAPPISVHGKPISSPLTATARDTAHNRLLLPSQDNAVGSAEDGVAGSFSSVYGLSRETTTGALDRSSSPQRLSSQSSELGNDTWVSRDNFERGLSLDTGNAESQGPLAFTATNKVEHRLPRAKGSNRDLITEGHVNNPTVGYGKHFCPTDSLAPPDFVAEHAGLSETDSGVTSPSEQPRRRKTDSVNGNPTLSPRTVLKNNKPWRQLPIGRATESRQD
jgi:hypothetical protein